jgi:predicted TIM-barrel fold metal-dependent hydrolase
VEIVDGQLHEFGPRLPWRHASPETRDGVLEELALASMAAVGVDAAVFHPLGSMTWACNLAAREPGRFAIIPMLTNLGMDGSEDMVDPAHPDVESRITEILSRPGVAGLRLVPPSPSTTLAAGNSASSERADPLAEGTFDAALRICERRGIPVFFAFGGRIEVVEPIVRAFSELTVVIDHMGVAGPPHQHDPWWKAIPATVGLAEYPNVHVKVSSGPVFSKEGFPFRDIRPQVINLVNAYGSRRLMWGSDISRFQGKMGWHLANPALQGDYPGRHTYAQSLAFITDADWLDDEQKADMLGRTVRRILSWSPLEPGTSPPP